MLTADYRHLSHRQHTIMLPSSPSLSPHRGTETAQAPTPPSGPKARHSGLQGRAAAPAAPARGYQNPYQNLSLFRRNSPRSDDHPPGWRARALSRRNSVPPTRCHVESDPARAPALGAAIPPAERALLAHRDRALVINRHPARRYLPASSSRHDVAPQGPTEPNIGFSLT